MKTVATALAAVLVAAGVPAASQDTGETSTSDEFDEAFDEMSDAGDAAEDTAEAELQDETIGDWRLYDGPTADGERRVFMHKDVSPESYLEFDMSEGGGATVTFGDPECGSGSSFNIEELGGARAAGLADKFAEMLADQSCEGGAAVPTVEELVEPLAKLEEWVAERPFPAATYWKPEDRVLTIGQGEGRGVGRYEGRVSVVYLEPGEDARGPAEVIVNIYDCAGFDGRTLPVRSGDPAEAQDIARAVLEQRAAACELEPGTPARIVDGLPEGLAAARANTASLAEEDDYDPYADDQIEAEADPMGELPPEPDPNQPTDY